MRSAVAAAAWAAVAGVFFFVDLLGDRGEFVELEGEEFGVVLEVPGGVGADGSHGERAVGGVEGFAGELRFGEAHEPVGGPDSHGVGDGDEAGDVGAGAGHFFGAGGFAGGGEAVDVGVDEGVFVPLGEERTIFADGAAHAVGEDEVGIGDVAEEDADGPAANACFGQECGVEIGLAEEEDAAIEGFNAAAVAGD